MTKEEAIQHNKTVIRNVIEALIEGNFITSVEVDENPYHLVDMISTYIQCANIARESMHMPKIVLYDISEL